MAKDQTSESSKPSKQIRTQWVIILIALIAGLSFLLLLFNTEPGRVFIAALSALIIIVTGSAILGSMARPIPEPPPPGELRKVKIVYQCELCGTELKMTLANDESPEPPKHCTEPMREIQQI